MSLLKEFQVVFDPRVPGYNDDAGPIRGIINKGPVEPPSIKAMFHSIFVNKQTCSKASLISLRLRASSATSTT